MEPATTSTQVQVSCSRSNVKRSRVFLLGTGMGLLSEATAVELGIQTREDGKSRVR